jgi:hypothetical protein
LGYVGPDGARAASTHSSLHGVEARLGDDGEPPVFEIDEEWFGGNLARATTARAAAPAGDVADAFHALLSAEQGSPAKPAAMPLVEPFAISDDAVERIASRVAERLSEGVFLETVRHVVEDVAERLVREEIARIRARAEEQPR